MKTENAELMRMAQRSLDGKWVLGVGTFFIYMVIVGGIQSIPYIIDLQGFGIVSFIIAGPFSLGINIFALNIYRDQEPGFENIFDGFKNFVNAFAAYVFMMVFVFLWALLLIIPGIIAGIAYSQTFFLMADDPKLGPMDAIDKSKAMMDGFKMKYFTLSLRIFGLALLSILTLGIGFFFLAPYAQVLLAAFYEDVKSNQPQTTLS